MTSPRPFSRRLALGAVGLSLLAACQAPAPQRILPEDGTIDLLSLLRDKPEYRRFLNAILVSGQNARIGARNGAVTLFVPTNESLNALPADFLAVLDNPPATPTPEQRQRAAALVNANAAFGLLRLVDIQPRQGRVMTWDRATLQVNRTGDRTATVARQGRPPVTITRADVLASDGVFHVTSAPVLSGI